ncbi:MAG: peptidylprolyl isomerase [Gammaproteobacteria bacterium]
MKIAEKKVVTINYILKDSEDNVIDTASDGTFAYLHGASNIIPGLESALDGKVGGDELSVAIAPEDAYGVRDDSRVEKVPRSMFPENEEIKSGMQFNAQGPDGQMIMITIAGIEDDHVLVDANHPLAGVHLNFDVEIVGVRDASEEEIEHGHVHGPDGHHH